MKMTKQDYEQLKADIKTVGDALGRIDIYQPQGETGLLFMHQLHTLVNQNRAYDDEWFKTMNKTRVLPYTGRDYCHLYHKGLHDTHIATALRKIRNELLAESLR